jgi:hypothetical protein
METNTTRTLDVPFDLLGTADSPVSIPAGSNVEVRTPNLGPVTNVYQVRLDVVLMIGPEQPPSIGAIGLRFGHSLDGNLFLSDQRQPFIDVTPTPGEVRYSHTGDPSDQAVRVQVVNYSGPDIKAWVKATYLDRDEATIAEHIAAGRGV